MKERSGLMDQIIIENLEVFAYHGVFQEENQNGQEFYVNAILNTDTRIAGKTDDLEASTDYGEVCRVIHTYMTERVCKLIETVAEGLAETILLSFPKVRSLVLEIRKPHAPIPLPFSSVSVKIERGWHRVYVAVGSNMGDREKYIRDAITEIKKHALCNVGRTSTILRTTPYGGRAEGEFLNGMLEIDTLLSPEELLEVLHEIEQKAGRERTVHWGSRTLDLDIILYDDIIMHTENLIIPHCDMENRDFVLQPLCEIAPYMRHPLTHQTIRQMLEQLQKKKEQHIIE